MGDSDSKKLRKSWKEYEKKKRKQDFWADDRWDDDRDDWDEERAARYRREHDDDDDDDDDERSYKRRKTSSKQAKYRKRDDDRRSYERKSNERKSRKQSMTTRRRKNKRKERRERDAKRGKSFWGRGFWYYVPTVFLGLMFIDWAFYDMEFRVIAGITVVASFLLAQTSTLKDWWTQREQQAKIEAEEKAREDQREEHPFAKVLGEAHADQAKLMRVATTLQTERIATKIRAMAEKSDKLIRLVEQDADRLRPISRFFTYYLPSAVKLAEGFKILENLPDPNPERVAGTEEMMDRLDDAFDQMSRKAYEADIGKHDIEMRLLDQSLEEELERTSLLEK